MGCIISCSWILKRKKLKVFDFSTRTPTPANFSQYCIYNLAQNEFITAVKGLNLFNVMIKNTMLAYQNMPLAHFTNGIDIIFASVFIVTGSCNNDNRA